MGAETIGAVFEELRTLAAANLLGGASGRRLDCDHIHAIDSHARHLIAGGFAKEIGLDLCPGQRHSHRIEVVLAHEQHRQMPQRCQVHAFVEFAFIDCAVAEEAGGDRVAPLQLVGEGNTDGHRQATPYASRRSSAPSSGVSFFSGRRSTPGTCGRPSSLHPASAPMPATSQFDWLISMTAITVLFSSRAASDLLRSFGCGMGHPIGLFAATMMPFSRRSPHSISGLPAYVSNAPRDRRRNRGSRQTVGQQMRTGREIDLEKGAEFGSRGRRQHGNPSPAAAWR
jgi:hypothetical protein